MLLQRYAGCPHQFSYKAAKAVMLGNKKIKRTHSSDLKKALNIYGININFVKRKFNFATHKSKDLILFADLEKEKNEWHWMIWDAKKQKLIDPEKGKKRTLSNVNYCIIIDPK
jgi:hypothetical protein